jgi:hypothetical protein
VRDVRVLVLLFALVSTAVFAGVAAADHLDPQERLRASDQKRASAMLVRRTDLPAGFAPERTSGLEPHFGCRALDESDLVLTGKAASPYWAHEYRVVKSSAAIYRTTADSRAAWRRETSGAGLECVRDEFRREFARQGETMRITIRPLSFPSLSVSAERYRLSISGTSPPGQPPLLFIDVVVLRHGRAQVGLLFAGIVRPPPGASEIAISELVAGRMRTAMRGA